MRVTVELCPFSMDPEMIEIRTRVDYVNRPAVHRRQIYDPDMFRSCFDVMMEDVINTIHDFVGNNPDEKRV